MTYISVDYLRDEGVDADDYSDLEVETAIVFAQEYIERICHQYFEQRQESRLFDGNSANILSLDLPIISIEQIEWRENNVWCTQDLSNFVAYNRIPQDQSYPRISVRSDYRERLQNSFYESFPSGELNIRVTGQWGFVESSSEGYVTPRLIQKACGILAVIWMNGAGNGELIGLLKQWGVVEERTSKHSYKLSSAMAEGDLTGVGAIDNILKMFKRKAVVTHV